MNKLAIGLLLLALVHGELEPRCGDCWCSNGDEECPADTTGIVDTFDVPREQVLTSFVLTNDPDFLKLQTGTGEECFPFADLLGEMDRYPTSSLPQCTIPASTDETVCAFKFAANTTDCSGREYEVVTYDSASAATNDGAYVTHKGACGVCSSAQDLFVRMDKYYTLEEDTLIHAALYAVSQSSGRFDTLVGKFQAMGFTDGCATLWAHMSATNAAQCAIECLPGADGTTPLSLEPPACEYAPCLACSVGFYEIVDKVSGRNLQNSGITEDISRPCSSFYRVNHDACVDTNGYADDITQSPTQAPTSGATHQLQTVLTFMVVLAMTGLPTLA